MKKIKIIIGIGLFFLMDYAFTTQPNGLNPISIYAHWDSLGYSGADSAVYQSIAQDKDWEKGDGE